MASFKVKHGQGGIPMGTSPQFWSSGNVYLSLDSGGQMTWHDWFEVSFYIRVFVDDNNFRGTQFLIMKDGHGLIGAGSINGRRREESVANNTSVSVLPDPVPEPYDMRFWGMAIELYAYRGSVSEAGLDGCVHAAYNDIQLHYGSGQTTIRAPSLSYTVGGVNLYLRPERNLTWDVWFNFPLRIQGFTMDNGLRETQFILLSDEHGQIGSGQLVSVPGASKDTA